ncbi:sensor histidine kinase [Microvirga roseola]|uniref:sensor histidine kinase n=1 Tax=Microvirga roseola TaxID=2883126 RepID=UPI001E57D8BD|nr:HWE histidine kinase domain-containing protein [Microvirga roseola]
MLGRTIREALPELAGQGFYELLDEVYASGKPFIGRQMQVMLQRRSDIALEARYVDFVYQPIRDSDGEITGIFVEGHDVTDQKLTELALRDSEAEFRGIADITPALVWVCSESGENIFVNERWYEYTGQSFGEASGLGWAKAMHPEDAERIMPYWLRCQETGERYVGEVRYRRRDGEYRWHAFEALPHRSENGTVEKWFGVSVDIHERKRWEEHQRLLIHELNHRVKNTLAIVQAIARQSYRPSRDGGQALEARLLALASAHNLLTSENWEKAELSQIVEQAVAPFRRGDGSRFDVEGPQIHLDAKMALALAMALHELGTNAANYGALSLPSGRVMIHWAITFGEMSCLALSWQEQGGPPVTSPTRKGFGSRLITRSLAAELGGEVRLDFEPTGLVCTISARVPALRS